MQQITPTQLRDILQGDNLKPLIIDVREEWEYELCAIDGSIHIPMNEITDNMHNLDNSRDIVVVCHHGMRGRQVATTLKKGGFRAKNLLGGIHHWALQIDSSMARY